MTVLEAFSPNPYVHARDYSSDDDDADLDSQPQQFDWNQHGFQLDTGDLNAWLNDDDDEPPALGIHIFRYDTGTHIRRAMDSSLMFTGYPPAGRADPPATCAPSM